MSHNALLSGSVESIQAFPVHVRRLMMLGVIGIEAGGKVPGAPARKTLILGRLGGGPFFRASPRPLVPLLWDWPPITDVNF
jgi:hypothetical protein